MKQEGLSVNETLLAQNGYLVNKTRGRSMEPMLRQNRDLVTVQVPLGRLKKYDVAMYKRGTAFVLHRVIRVKENGYQIRGDNTYVMENVPDEAVVGILTSFVRKGKQHSVTERGYRCYVRFWHLIYPLRFAYVRSRRLAGRIARKLHLLPPAGKRE